MKRIIAIITVLILTLSLAACGGAPDQTEMSSDKPSYTASETADNGSATDSPSNEEENSLPPSDNVFYNPNNTAFDANAVSVKPGRVYYDGETLVAECFVINGFGHNVYGISVNELTLSNEDGVIATAGFGELRGLTLAPYTYSTWTFYFSDDCIESMTADLTESLICNSKTSNYY